MRTKDPFKNIIPEYVLILIVLGFIIWLALGSITEFASPSFIFSWLLIHHAETIPQFVNLQKVYYQKGNL